MPRISFKKSWSLRWFHEEAFMLGMASIGKDKFSQRCVITHWPIEWLYVFSTFIVFLFLFLRCFMLHDLNYKINIMSHCVVNGFCDCKLIQLGKFWSIWEMVFANDDFLLFVFKIFLTQIYFHYFLT